MASSSGVTMEGDFTRRAEYTPKSTGQSETDIDKRLVSKCRAGESGAFALFHYEMAELVSWEFHLCAHP